MDDIKRGNTHALFDFAYLDSLEVKAAGQGRVFSGHAAKDAHGLPVVLFVHGGYHGAWCFAHYLRYFDAAGIPAAAIDMRGHGGLPQDPGFHLAGIRDMAGDVIAACAAMPGPPVLVGHSMGALVAAVAGETCAPAGLGLLAPSPPGQLEILKPLPFVPEGAPYGPPDAAVCKDKFLAGEPVTDLAPFAARLCPESPLVLNDRYGLRIRIDRTRFGMPALCLAAGRDTAALHPPGQDRATAEFFGAEFHEFENAPHCMMLSVNWRDSAELLASWYRRITEVAA